MSNLQQTTVGKFMGIHIASISELLDLIESLDGYGLATTDEEELIARIQELYPTQFTETSSEEGAQNV